MHHTASLFDCCVTNLFSNSSLSLLYKWDAGLNGTCFLLPPQQSSGDSRWLNTFTKHVHPRQAYNYRSKQKSLTAAQLVFGSLLLSSFQSFLHWAQGYFSVLFELCACHGLEVTAPFTVLELVGWSYESDKADIRKCRCKSLALHSVFPQHHTWTLYTGCFE